MNALDDGNTLGSDCDVDDHWLRNARVWRQIGPPLRPSGQDIGFLEEAVAEWVRHRGAPRVLLLGVTPEIYRLSWPEGTDFLAVDRNQAMIDAAWPGPGSAVQCADWLTVSLPDNSRDIVLCDGGLHLLGYPREQNHLVRRLRNILSDRGLCILRLFVPPAKRESPDAVLEDLLAGRIPNVNILKLRLGWSLLDSAEGGVEMGKVWQAIHEAVPNLEALAGRIGWPSDHLLAIDAYRDSTARYHFVTLEQVRDMFRGTPGGFEVHSVRVPSYELGGQCLTVVFQRGTGGMGT